MSFGLDAEYKNPDSELGSWLKRFFGLMFVAPRDVQDNFAFDYLDDMPDDQRCMDFADYMLNTNLPFRPKCALLQTLPQSELQMRANRFIITSPIVSIMLTQISSK